MSGLLHVLGAISEGFSINVKMARGAGELAVFKLMTFSVACRLMSGTSAECQVTGSKTGEPLNLAIGWLTSVDSDRFLCSSAYGFFVRACGGDSSGFQGKENRKRKARQVQATDPFNTVLGKTNKSKYWVALGARSRFLL